MFRQIDSSLCTVCAGETIHKKDQPGYFASAFAAKRLCKICKARQEDEVVLYAAFPDRAVEGELSEGNPAYGVAFTKL